MALLVASSSCALAMDKTGTLTAGRPDVVDVVAADGVEEEELLSMAAAVKQNSLHPLAAAVVRRAEEQGLDVPEAGDLERDLGGAGTAAALETADVALMGDALEGIPFAVGLSRQTRRVIRQNLFVSLTVIALLIVSTTTGFLEIGAAVVVHEGRTLVVVANALRLLRYGR